MKKLILFFSVLAFSGTTPAMEIGIIKQFENRRPAFGRFKVDGTELRDFNRDGVPDISVAFNDTIFVIDPLTNEHLWTWDVSNVVSAPAAVVWGFLDMKGQSSTTHALFYDDTNKSLYIVNVTDNVIEYQDGDDLFLRAVLERPNNGKQVLAAIDVWEHAVVIIGETGGGITSAKSHPANVSGPLTNFAADYQLELKFQAEPGLRLAYDPDLFDPRHDMDIDGDERMDIPMIIEDPNANDEPIGMVVRGGDNFDVLWQFPFPAEHKENILKGFFGFVDANGDGEKEAIFGENLAVTLDGAVHTIADNFVILDVNDVDGDGFEDIIGMNTTDSTIVVYGAANTTSVAGADPAKIHFQLFQNYPNPFNPSTTISYSVAKTGSVELDIYNALGQLVRTLFSGQKAAGEYSLNWDGRDDFGRLASSGQYFYRLQVGPSTSSGQVVQTRRMLFLK